MNNFFYVFYALLLAVVSVFTGELVTFVMLGFILIVLNSIHKTLKQILKVQKNQ